MYVEYNVSNVLSEVPLPSGLFKVMSLHQVRYPFVSLDLDCWQDNNCLNKVSGLL